MSEILHLLVERAEGATKFVVYINVATDKNNWRKKSFNFCDFSCEIEIDGGKMQSKISDEFRR